MTDATITHTLTGVPAGSETCGGCQHRINAHCSLFDRHITSDFERCGRFYPTVYYRLPDCLAAEQRFTDQPPTEPGWYKARLRRTGKWRIVEVTMVFGELRAYSVVGKYGRSLTHFDSWSTRLTMPGGE